MLVQMSKEVVERIMNILANQDDDENINLKVHMV